MIVDPDFLEHWKTRMLIDMLGDEAAPLYVIRLWGHCQNRREWVFDGMPIHATKAICRFNGEAHELEKALIECGFLEREHNKITVVGWDEHNASLIANWKNGSRGGRPKKNPKEPDKKPMGLPSDNPRGTDKIGLDRIRLDEINTVISYLNDRAGKRFQNVQGNAKHINARLKEGHTVEGMKLVIDRKVAEWKNGPMDEYLRPKTLFNSENFEGYLNAAGPKPSESRHTGFEGRDYSEGIDPDAGEGQANF